MPPEADEAFDIGASDDSLAKLTQLFAQHGDIVRVYAPTRRSHTWVINHPDDIRRVLVSNHRNYLKGLGFDRVKMLLGNGIVTSDGELWKRQRYMMQPAFHSRVLARFGELIDTRNSELLARWDARAAAREAVNVTLDMSTLALDIILEAILGLDLAAFRARPEGNPFDIFTDESARDLRFAYRFRQLTREIAAIVERRRGEPAEAHFDFLGMMLHARDRETGAGMSTRELVDEVTTLIVAGHETTANTLNCTWMLLSGDERVEGLLHAEVDAAVVDAADPLAVTAALPYARAVLDETLRLYPPVWLFSRIAVEADTLSGFALPAGSDVLLSPYHLHRHPRYWPDPEQFRPERFLADHAADRPRFAYVPFSGGPRHCIGEAFSFNEMLVHLAKFARRYSLRRVSPEPVAFEAQVNLRTRDPIHMYLERRA